MSKRFGNKDFLVVTALAVVLFAAAFGTAVYLRVTAPADDGSYLPGEQEITPEIELLQQYVRLKTVPGREIEGARFLIDYLSDHGIDAELIISEEGRANVYARLNGRIPDQGLMLLHHIDVMPADPKDWTQPPFAAEVHLNRLYGRGVLDMKGIGIAELLAFVEAAERGEPLERDLVFLAVADEERGSRLGMRWLMEHRPDLFEGLQYAINEGGITEMLRDRIEYFAVEIAGKQVRGFRIVADDESAIDELRDRWEDLRVAPEMEVLLPEVERYFATIAPYRRHFGPLLEDIRETEREGRLPELHPTYLELLQNNVALSEPRPGPNGRVEANAVLWYLPGEDPEPLTRRIREDVQELGGEVSIDPGSSPGIVGFSSLDTPFFELFARKVRQTYGEEIEVGPTIATKGVTDCRFLRARAIDCYGIWPFPVNVYDSTGIHGVDERLRLDWFLQGVRLMREVVLEWVTK